MSEELTSDKRRKSLWQNCIDICDGDEEKEKFMYFKTRLQRLKDEVAGK
ncbi:hypothetical protein G8764_16725 [Pseudomaricurvus alcaniphilus]|nr:hypothetical protein [Pseudomaricurvus alcaniphilus]NHN38955.1 hypothetical protein [Pseudomaricurvus alcaniphilus]